MQGKAEVNETRHSRGEVQQITHTEVKYRVNKKKITGLARCEMNSIRPIFKTEILIHQSKANFRSQNLVW